jgi:hypothetical protein
MRLFYFLFCLSFPAVGFSQACTSADIPAAGGTLNCTTLTIDIPVHFTPNDSASALEITVSGDVMINADIDISGVDGANITADNIAGAIGGPGASEGGGIFIVDAGSGSDLSSSDGGGAGANNGAGNCNNGGGGGGGVTTIGTDGTLCPFGGVAGVGGVASGFPSPFRGGYGGGAGGADPVVASVFDAGAGGGGGGGLHISATGTITIKNGVHISARGGKGGNTFLLGGAGGGGSGGVIWLESGVAINNKGIIDVRGGAGGINTKSGTPRGGVGGAGGDGLFRSQIGASVTDDTGLSNFSSSVSGLKSSISCGTVDKKENLPQAVMGFALALLLGTIIKILSRSRELLS